MKIFNRTFIYKLTYLLVIATLLIINFTKKEVHTYNIEGLEVVETAFVEMPLIPKKIKSLNIQHKGINFDISYKKPVTITSDDGITRKSHIISVSTTETTLRVKFQNNVELLFRVDNYGERLTISSAIPKVFPTIKRVAIPFKILSEFELERTDLSQKFFSKTDEFHLKLNDNYFISDNKDFINLVAENDKVSTLTFSPLDTKQLPIAEQWYMKHRDNTIKAIDTIKDEYLAKIEYNINETYNPIKYNPELRTWENSPEKATITEDALIVYLAQSVGETDYLGRIERVNSIRAKYPKLFGFKSSPYLGNIVALGQDGIDDDLRKLKDIQSFIRTSNSTLLNSYIPEHFFEDQQLNISLLERFVNRVDKETLNLKQLTVTLEHLTKILESGTTSSISSNSIKEITNIIISKIKWDETGLYLVENLEPSSQKLNLEAGLLLIKASQHETSEYSKPIGEALINTFINNSDTTGAVSKTYDMNTKKFSTAKLNPEELYISLSNNPHLPHFYIDKGIKVWTISDSITINKNQNDTSITISYPVKNSSAKNSHHIIVSGITPYKQLYYRGQPWRADKNFEKWGVGYYYEQSTQLLFFMPNHNRTREKIVITYE